MLEKNDRGLLQYSGGADSTALLYMARPWLDQITVVFCDPGATYPHMVEHIVSACRKVGAKLEIISPQENVRDYTNRVGLPSDVVPLEAMTEIAPLLRDKPKQFVQSSLKCCSAMIWEPMARAVKASGANVVLRGSKKSDQHVGVPDGYVEDGITYKSPLWNMSDTEVADYIEREGISLPEHYKTIRSSLDCACCSAFLHPHGSARLEWTKKHYPGLFPDLAHRMNALKQVLDGERAKFDHAFDVVGHL